MSVSKQRCLFIVPSLKRGGAETQLVDLVNRLDDNLFDKHLVVLEQSLDQLDKVNSDVIKIHYYSKKGFFDWQVIRQLADLIDEVEIDVIHATMQYSAFFAWLACKLAKRKPRIIAVIHTTKNVGIKEELFDRVLYRYVLKQCHEIIFVCHAQRNYWLNKYPELKAKSRVIYNGIEVDDFRKDDYLQEGRGLKQQYSITDDVINFSCIAGFRPEKGHFILLNAFAEIKQKNVRLLLAGDGPLRAKAERLVEKLQLQDKVIFLGNLADVRPLLSISNAMILSSTAVETFSMAMLEAMSMQVPVIATDIGGLSEAIIEGETGFLIQPGSKECLKDALERFLNIAQGNGLGVLCRDKVKNSFTADQMIKETASSLLN